MSLNNLKQFVAGLVLYFLSMVAWSQPYLYSSVCPKGPDGSTPGGGVYGGYWVTTGGYWADRWGFAQCNCTSYVAGRINMNGLEFQNTFRGQHWSNAMNWDNAAIASGMVVDSDPQPGYVAQWNEDEIGGVGHVAYVESVTRNADGSIQKIKISQYNSGVKYGYSDDELIPGKPGYPPRFIHFDIRAPKSSSIGWFPSVPICTAASQWFLIGTVNGKRGPIGTAAKSSCPLACYPE